MQLLAIAPFRCFNRTALSALAGILLAGCASAPFAEPTLPPLGEATPAMVLQEWREAVPERFVSEVSLVIETPWQRTAALGCLRVDCVAGTFELVAMNHAGFKLFDLFGDRQSTQVRFAAPVLAEHPELLPALADDLRHAFFDLVPPADAEATTTRDVVRFLAPPGDDGRREYVFGGEGRYLLRIACRRDWWRNAWQVGYYEYVTQSGGCFPRGIVVERPWPGFHLVIKQRNWQPIHAPDSPMP